MPKQTIFVEYLSPEYSLHISTTFVDGAIFVVVVVYCTVVYMFTYMQYNIRYAWLALYCNGNFAYVRIIEID